MSRVDEALKRATGTSAPADIGRTPSSVSRAFEEFPLEDRRNEFRVEEPRPSGPALAPVREFGATPIAAPRIAGAHPLTRLAPAVDGKVVVDDETSAASVEEYRRLATSLHLMQTQTGLRTLMISSALPRDGKTLTSTNLALTLSEGYKRRVLLIDADLRRPSIHEVFRVPNSVGLVDGLRGDGPVSLPYIEVSNYLTILTSGSPDAAPMAGLTSARMRTVLDEARRHFDWVILDTPPVGLISDANILGGLVDGVLLVIGAGATPYPAVQRALSEFGRDRILGIVLNRVNDDLGGGSFYREYYPAYTKETAKP
jgi:capsular exopolysaccharide synthesis family protein